MKTETEVLPAWWVSWYCGSPGSEFELHSPYWISGYDADDRTIYCAAVRAADEAAAYDLVRASYDDEPSRFEERFCEPLSGAPFTSRWPKAGWMAWDDDGTTCACPDHRPASPLSPVEGEPTDGETP